MIPQSVPVCPAQAGMFLYPSFEDPYPSTARGYGALPFLPLLRNEHLSPEKDDSSHGSVAIATFRRIISFTNSGSRFD